HLEQKLNDLLEKVPGYTGYRSKEDRRDDDRRLRETIAGSLDTTAGTLTGVSADLARQRKLTHISTIERMVGTTRLLADRVRSASYGYGGVFGDRSIDEFALDQLRQFDATFQQEARSLDALANRLAASPEGPLDVDINEYQAELNRLGLLFDARGEVVESARPNRDAAVLSLLEQKPKSEPKASPLASLRVGDTLSILGDNFLVDATVAFNEPDRQVTISRVGDGTDGRPLWLLGSTAEDMPSARLSETEGGTADPSTGQPAEARVTTGTDSKAGVAARYGYTASADGNVSFWYALGSESRFFTGAAVEDDDVEVYGQA
ncbi:MAG: hypothetical protein M3457_06750, partial [Chloroflexota bacterium]|nr:hypothetical protein [Chloroflexota bacterium]